MKMTFMDKAVYSSKTKAATIPPIAATATTLPTAMPIITGIESPPEVQRKQKPIFALKKPSKSVMVTPWQLFPTARPPNKLSLKKIPL